MSNQTAEVVAVETDAVWVTVADTHHACHQCSAKKGCGLGLLNRMGRQQGHTLRIPLHSQSYNVSLGDNVTISIPPKTLIYSAFIVYLLPLLTLLSGAVLGSPWGNITSFIGATCGFVMGFGLVRVHAYCTRQRPDLQPFLEQTSHLSKSQAPLTPSPSPKGRGE